MPGGRYESEERARRTNEQARHEGRWRNIYPDAAEAEYDEYHDVLAPIPIIGGFSRDAINAARDEAERQTAERVWRELLRDAPTDQDLVPYYYLEDNRDAYGDLLGDPSALKRMDPRGSGDQQTALRALYQLYQGGGWTDRDAQVAADMRRLGAMERGQQLRGANEAALQQSYARGMGGGGAELGARLSASQGLAQGQAMHDASTNASLQQAAMQRALAALQGYGSMANTQAGQDLGRRQALDAFNQANMAWRRGREERNTGIANRQQDARIAARQTAWQNQLQGVQGLTNRYPGGSRPQGASEQTSRFLGGLLDF